MKIWQCCRLNGGQRTPSCGVWVQYLGDVYRLGWSSDEPVSTDNARQREWCICRLDHPGERSCGSITTSNAILPNIYYPYIPHKPPPSSFWQFFLSFFASGFMASHLRPPARVPQNFKGPRVNGLQWFLRARKNELRMIASIRDVWSRLERCWHRHLHGMLTIQLDLAGNRFCGHVLRAF